MNKVFTAFLLLASLCSVKAADIRTVFKEMPDSVLPLLSQVNRLDMLDFLDGGMRAAVRNRLDGISELVSIDKDMVSIRYTDKSDVSIRLFYYKDSIPLICVVHTVESVVRDSRVLFYDSHWKPVDGARLLSVPTLKDFIAGGADRDSIASLEKVSMVRSVQASVSDNLDGIAFHYTGLGCLDADSARFAGYLRREPVVYLWNGKRFVREKRVLP